jgi:hypothetical protein
MVLAVAQVDEGDDGFGHEWDAAQAGGRYGE